MGEIENGKVKSALAPKFRVVVIHFTQVRLFAKINTREISFLSLRENLYF